MNDRDWVTWHAPYDEPGSNLDRRLRWVQRRIGQALDEARPGPIRVLSLCAGQGRDLLEVLPDHPRRDDVAGLLVELDERNVAHARAQAEAEGLDAIEVLQAGAARSFPRASPPGRTGVFHGGSRRPLWLCGSYGNISDEDIATTVRHLPELCAPGAVTFWTRHRGAPDLTPAIRQWYMDAGFEEVAFDSEDGFLFGVGTARLTVPPPAYVPDRHLFDFVGH